MNKIKNIASIQDLLYDLATGSQCCFQYFHHELEGIGHSINKHNYLYTVEFEKEYSMINFIKQIKNFKEINIDTIYQNINKFEMIYNKSSKSQNKITPEIRNKYPNLCKILNNL